MKKIPFVAELRHDEAISKFCHKLDLLDQLIKNNKLDVFPKRVSISSFSSWEDQLLGVMTISRSVIYSKKSDAMVLHQRMEQLLNLLVVSRLKSSKKINKVVELRQKLAISESRSQSYINQYSKAMVDLNAANDQIERLGDKLRRIIAQNENVISIQKNKR